ncbi:MAG: dethiobiotin synthase [Proteobacteria bacterium]|nr:dethiobiotin synthase [Pseudomonadota bacterium]
MSELDTVLRGCFVTGTDTEVGKTRVSAGLLHWLAVRGLRCAGYKPVAAGIERLAGESVNEDVRLLHRESSVSLSMTEVGPCQLQAACAPHIAAELQGRTIERAALVAGACALAGRVDHLVVEGAGGFCVPLGQDFDTADLAGDLGLPVVLVVGLRLGCLNHALLSVEAIRARGLRLAGWVANTVDPSMLHPFANLRTLRALLGARGAPCLGVIPRLTDPSPAQVSTWLDDDALHTLFALQRTACQGFSPVRNLTFNHE